MPQSENGAPFKPTLNRRSGQTSRRTDRHPLSPEPSRERQSPHDLRALARGREPSEFTTRTIGRAGRAGANPIQTGRLGPRADRLAALTRHLRAVPFKRITVGKPQRTNSGLRMRVADDSVAWQGAADQKRSVVIAEIFRFVRRPHASGNEGAEIQTSGYLVFVEVEDREAIRRIPASTATSRVAGVEGVDPLRVRDTPPNMVVRDRLGPQFHDQACAFSKRNISRHAASIAWVSPCANRSTRESPPRALIGRRTTTRIRSRLR